jgi:hypothetical protein
MKKALMPSFDTADQDALALANTVDAALTGNTDFPTPTPSLLTLQGAITTTTASLAKAKYGSRDDRAQKNADKKNLIGILRDLCNYVNSTAQGDITMLSGAGFPLSKDPQPRTLGTADAKVEAGASGQLILSTPGVTGAIAYKHQYTEDSTVALWPEITTTKATCKIDGLVPGKLYHMRIVSIGTKDQVTISNVVTKIVA